MEKQGYIEIRVTNQDNSLLPKDVDINDIKSMISDIETFLYPERTDKKNRPHISYDLQEGSAKHKFFLPISAVIFFNGLTSEIYKRKNLDFLEYKRQDIIVKFQKTALKNNYRFEFNNSLEEKSSLLIDKTTNYELVSAPFFESEFYIYGEIYQEGGKNPNLHIHSKKYGNLTISTTKEQIMEGEKRTYKFYGIKVKGKKNFIDGKLSDLVLLEYIHYNPIYNKSLLEKIIHKASVNLSKITNVDTWVNNLKADNI